MKTTCYICGRTDESDLSKWGQSSDYGFYHLSCAAAAREREQLQATDAPSGIDMEDERCSVCGLDVERCTCPIFHPPGASW